MASAADQLSKTLECPVCLETLKKPIKQCMKGHSFCTACLDPLCVSMCPVCRGSISETRNYILEQLLDTMVLPCVNKNHGCSYLLEKEMMKLHIEECYHRKRECPGKTFCNWSCSWDGYDLLDHFKKMHREKATMEYATTVCIPFNNLSNYTDLHVISAHYRLFYYKHKVDVDKKMAYWCIQYIGPKKQAGYYYYEFELFLTDDPVRKFKVTEYCQSDAVDVNDIFNSEKCVAVSFNTLTTYVKNSEYSFRFRIMKAKKDESEVKSPHKISQNHATTTPKQKARLPQQCIPPASPPIPWLFGHQQRNARYVHK